MRDFVLAVPMEYRNLHMGGLSTPLRGVVTIFYQSMRSDVDAEILWDCLQLAGVVKNDRFIREKLIYGAIDKKNPRAEIIVEQL